MRVSLATSLHLNHGATGPHPAPGARPIMQSFVPMGLLCVKALADRELRGVDTRVTELNTLINSGRLVNDDRFYEHAAEAVVERGDALVGLMTDADSLHHTLSIAQAVSECEPRTRICLGGPASSPIGALLLESYSFLDYIVSGEGEWTYVELVCALRRGEGFEAIRGLTWRDGGRVRVNPARVVVADLDTLPVPSFDAFDMSQGALYLDAGRGCPFACQFCSTAPFWKRAYRMKSVDRIVEEMRLVRDRYGRTHANFSHDIFTFRPEWTRRFCARLAEERFGVTWTCSTRTDVMETELLPLMAEAGCVEIYYGIESGSPRIQREIHKGLDLDRASTVVEATGRAGIRAITGFIVGYPMETPDSLNETLTRYFEFLRVGRGRSYLFTLCPFHESPMFERHHGTACRPSESLDVPLSPRATERCDRVVRQSPDAFTSTQRYEIRDVPGAWVDACEELSASLVQLKNLWPMVLPLYTTPLDFYEGWVSWIARRNAGRCPDSRYRHQGDAHDLITFVTEELDRMGLGPCLLRDLVRYERCKLDAMAIPYVAAQDAAPARQVRLDTLVARRQPMLLEEFSHDMRQLLAGYTIGEAQAIPCSRWVVFTRRAPDCIDTVQLGAASKRLLDRAVSAISVAELIGPETQLGVVGRGAAALPEVSSNLALVQQLVNRGLLSEVAVA